MTQYKAPDYDGKISNILQFNTDYADLVLT